MKKDKRAVVAVTGVFILVLLYIVTLITAFLDIPEWDRLFRACLTATIGIPILLWIYLILYRKWKEQRQADEERRG